MKPKKIRNRATGESIEWTPGTDLPEGTYDWVLEPSDETYTDKEGQTVFIHRADGSVELGEGQTWESALMFVLRQQRVVEAAYNRRVEASARAAASPSTEE